MPDPTLFERGNEQPINPTNIELVYKTLVKEPGMEFALEVNSQDPDPEKTISMDAVDIVVENAKAWILSRLTRKFKQDGRGAKKVQVSIAVSLDSEPITPNPDGYIPYISFRDLMDVQHRQQRRPKKHERRDRRIGK